LLELLEELARTLVNLGLLGWRGVLGTLIKLRRLPLNRLKLPGLRRGARLDLASELRHRLRLVGLELRLLSLLKLNSALCKLGLGLSGGVLGLRYAPLAWYRLYGALRPGC